MEEDPWIEDLWIEDQWAEDQWIIEDHQDQDQTIIDLDKWAIIEFHHNKEWIIVKAWIEENIQMNKVNNYNQSKKEKKKIENNNNNNQDNTITEDQWAIIEDQWITEDHSIITEDKEEWMKTDKAISEEEETTEMNKKNKNENLKCLDFWFYQIYN